jgi:hypothetical protein
VTEFNVHRGAPDGLQWRCRACSARWYVENRDAHRANVQRTNGQRRADNRARLVAHLLQHPCADCGETDLRVLDFDHRDPATKSATIGGLVALGHVWPRIQAEIDKCAVRCANCHRRRTAEDAGWNRHRAQQEVERTVAARARDRLQAVLSSR